MTECGWEEMLELQVTQPGIIKTIVDNWLEEGLITRDQESRACRMLGEYSVSALAGLLLESHTAKLENMLHYEAVPSPDRRN